MANKKLTRLKAVKGEALFAHLLSTEVYDGKDTNKYNITLVVPEKTKDMIEKQCMDEWENFARENKKKVKIDPMLPIKEYDGKWQIKASTNASFKNKKGEEVQITVPIFDAKLNQIRGKLTQEIGNGSIIKVSADILPYFMSDRNFGVALRLVGVQVLELKEWGNTAESAGFEAEEGYEMDDTNDEGFSNEGDF